MSDNFSFKNLETFVQEWQKILKEKPVNLIMSMNFRNLIIHSHKRLSEDGKNDVLKYSLEPLENIIQNETSEFKLLKDYIGIEYIKTIKGGRHSEIEPSLEDIKNKLSGDSYLKFLIEQLKLNLHENGKSKQEFIIVIAQLMIVELLNRYSYRQLQNIPIDILSNEYTRLIVNNKKNDFSNNKTIESELYATIENISTGLRYTAVLLKNGNIGVCAK